MRAVNDLHKLLAATRQIAAQTRQRLSGQTPESATRRVSLHDGDARPIAKGRLGRPVEFGYKAQVTDNDDGIVLDHTVERATRPTPRNWHRRSRGSPRAPGVRPHRHRRPRLRRETRRGRPARPRRAHGRDPPQRQTRPRRDRAAEHRRAFRRTIKWRTGCEGRISTLKRGYGWDRTRIDDTEGARIWAGHGVLTHNLVKISALAA